MAYSSRFYEARFNEGSTARLNDIKRQDCPYVDDTFAINHWLAGWDTTDKIIKSNTVQPNNALATELIPPHPTDHSKPEK